MSVADTTGVVALAQMLVQASRGDGLTVTQVAEQHGLARSTAFDIARRLQAVGLIERRPDGTLATGQAATALGFAAFGLAPLQGPAEALLTLLQERTGARVELVADGTIVVARGQEPGEAGLDAPILDAKGVERARLRLGWRADSSRAERVRIGVHFEQARLSLEHYLQRDMP